MELEEFEISLPRLPQATARSFLSAIKRKSKFKSRQVKLRF